MLITIGELKRNKTLEYLAPCLKSHGSDFVDKYSTVFTLAVGVFDFVFAGSEVGDNYNFYILLDKKWKPRQYEKFMSWIKLQDFYVTDYIFDNLLFGRKQMLVIKCPEQHYKTFEHFQQGEYSKMYQGQADLFVKTKFELDVINKTKAGRATFQDLLLQQENRVVRTSDVMEMEYDYPPEKEQNTFNSKYDEG